MTVVSETIIAVPDAPAVIAAFVAHMGDELGIVFDEHDDGGRSFEQDGFGILFRPVPEGLAVRLHGQSTNVLIFAKEEIAEHVAEYSPETAASIRWSGETFEPGALPPNFRVLEVARSQEIFEGMQRVTFTMDDAQVFATEEGVHIRLMLPLKPGRFPIWPHMAENGAPVWPKGDDELHARFVTIRAIRSDLNEIDVDIVRHQGGLISDWAAMARPGWKAGAMGPAGTMPIGERGPRFLAADGTGLPALARLIERLPPDAAGDVVIAMPTGTAANSYLPATSMRVHTLAPTVFRREIETLADTLTAPGTTRFAFFAGEFENSQRLRAMFKGRLGLGKNEQISVAYWREGMPGYGS
jgi:ferric-chelate reductase (NADPH)